LKEKYDRIILGAGIYGLYAALKSCEKGYKVLVLERDKDAFERGTYINQARLHNGYHYPRSYSTASKSAKYFQRFLIDFEDCINTDFTKVYAVASNFSWANGQQFKKFSDNLGVQCEEIDVSKYFNPRDVEKSFITHEYTFDAKLIKEKLLSDLKDHDCTILYNSNISEIKKIETYFEIILDDNRKFYTPFVLNATYASTNQIHQLLGYEKLNIKYELCEVILCNVSDNIKNVGITLMDGPFFSLMPFGKTGYHSLTTVSRTPHVTSYDLLPTFKCQGSEVDCSPKQLNNCNRCKNRPESAFSEMKQIAKKYLNTSIEIEYVDSLYTIKPIMKASEIDDSRPTIIRKYSECPDFYTVFSGKINTMYDLDEIL
jgi:hypothetical protein